MLSEKLRQDSLEDTVMEHSHSSGLGPCHKVDDLRILRVCLMQPGVSHIP
jgi:hypothetical protein